MVAKIFPCYGKESLVVVCVLTLSSNFVNVAHPDITVSYSVVNVASLFSLCHFCVLDVGLRIQCI